MLDNYSTVVSRLSIVSGGRLCRSAGVREEKRAAASTMSGMRPARLALLCGLAAAAVWPAAGPAAGTDQTVAITSSGFSPKTVTIAKGDTVTWQNNDVSAHTHTATADDGSWTTTELAPGTTAALVFTNAGTWPYHDKDKPSNRGTLVVTDSAPASTTSSTAAGTSTTARSTSSTSASSTTSTSASTTTTTLTPTTFPFEPVPEESTTTTTTTGGSGHDAAGPVHHAKGTPTGAGIVAALLLLGTSGATLLVLRRGQ
jgi:plastocyanin